MRAVMVDLLNDAEGYVPLDVEYGPSSNVRPYTTVNQRHSELASQSHRVAVKRAVKLAERLHLPYISHYT